jgi:hypothetical protein
MSTTGTESGTWYWCLRHSRVESGGNTNCPPEDRMGPYESADAATHWKDKADARNEKWDKEDKEWSGDD